MDRFLQRKRPRTSPSPPSPNLDALNKTSWRSRDAPGINDDGDDNERKDDVDDDSTDIKLAKLASVFPDISQDELLDLLIANEGSTDETCATLLDHKTASKKAKRSSPHSNNGPGTIQSSLSSFGMRNPSFSGLNSGTAAQPPPTRKGRTLDLFSPEDISRYTPCSIIHNFLPPEEATALLKELLAESKTFERQKFQLFEHTVQSPHSAGFYVASAEEQRQQKSEYSYNGNFRTDVRQLTPELTRVSCIVQKAVNEEIQKRIKSHYPDGKKLKYQSPKQWMPNAAFVNCYDGPGESVGYHSDELTYLGPRAVIGSLSLGVAREFRIRKIVPPDDEDVGNNGNGIGNGNGNGKGNNNLSRADIQGQISIHLPHNSLLVMHAEMQEEWKHSISPAQTISPHPVSGNKRINITYRWYREALHPKNTPRCRCNMPCVLRCVQRKKETRGKYMWMCYTGYAPGGQSCSHFQWAEFTDDGEPVWDGRGEAS